ncbi:ArdC-like ssDNA-binding domain-containing protein [Leucobacter allii]|uniref:ArdC-like ssDNA-binding domain-containing protein n=1 Tax=Leucobacter allii TaxID=2932247 RepID=UPI001FD40C14|nr:ArdC-like ssDNA-binding domain-containing protein [Leucobacter allii]UOR02372.1 ArdC-like ssDNA-binding domain-containing protein [Leucobacter allii]
MTEIERNVTHARAARGAKLDEVREQLNAQVEKLVTGEDWKRALTFAAKFRSRSVNNSWLIFAQHQAMWEAGRVPDPMPTYVAGFRQWEQLGRHVEKGQRGYAILAPVTGKFASPNPSDPMSWRKLAQKEQPRSGEVVRLRMIGAKVAYVFDISQTTGPDAPLPPKPQLLEGEAPAGLREGLIHQIEETGFTFMPVPHEGMIHGANGVTKFDDRQVAVRTNMDDAAQVKTLMHELAHVKMHGPDQSEARQHRGIGEVEAESVALMVGAAHGMDTSTYTIPYVSGWAMAADGKNPIQIVQATAERVRKVAVDILNQLDTVQISDGIPPGLTRPEQEQIVARMRERRTIERRQSTHSTSRRPARAASPAQPIRRLP